MHSKELLAETPSALNLNSRFPEVTNGEARPPEKIWGFPYSKSEAKPNTVLWERHLLGEFVHEKGRDPIAQVRMIVLFPFFCHFGIGHSSYGLNTHPPPPSPAI